MFFTTYTKKSTKKEMATKVIYSDYIAHLPTIGGNLGASLFKVKAVVIAPAVAPIYDRANLFSDMGLSPLLLV